MFVYVRSPFGWVLAQIWANKLSACDVEVVRLELVLSLWKLNCCGWVGIPGPVPPWLPSCCLILLSDISQYQISVVRTASILLWFSGNTDFGGFVCICQSWCLAFIFVNGSGEILSCGVDAEAESDSTQVLNGRTENERNKVGRNRNKSENTQKMNGRK